MSTRVATIKQHLSSSIPPAELVVSTDNGRVRGTALDGGGVVWRGLPFAAPPIGDLRFKKPKPLAETWEGVRDATDFGPCAPQATSFLVQDG